MDLHALFEDEGLYRVVALCCAAIATGECKDKSKGALATASQTTIALADNYLEWLDGLADLPEHDLPPSLTKGKRG